MIPKALVINCVIQYRKPFSAEIIANLTDLDLPVVQPILQELEADQMIKRISEKEAIYAYAQKREVRVGNEARKAWSYNQTECRSLVKLLTTKRYTSARTIAADFGKSRQWVFLYLEALASIDAIGIDKQGYYVKTGADLNKFGTVVKAGILKSLRNAYLLQRREQIKANNIQQEEERKRKREEYLDYLESVHGPLHWRKKSK